jgi:NADH-quinone oxidoreductase subunit E
MEQTGAAANLTQVDEILAKYDKNPTRLVPILQEIQSLYNFLPEEVMIYVAAKLKIPASTVYGVATFYAHFTLFPKGKHIIRICDGTACHVKKSESITNALRAELGLTDKKHTTDDQLFTLELVACLGACGLAPLITINESLYGQTTPESAVAAVRQIVEKEKAEV